MSDWNGLQESHTLSLDLDHSSTQLGMVRESADSSVYGANY